MKYKLTSFLTFIFIILLIYSCGNDDSRSCTTCNSSQTVSFTVCEESDGNASVNGENTGTSYAVYIDDLTEAGATCGN